MLRTAAGILFASALILSAADAPSAVPKPDIAGTLQLFDGETTFGWATEGKAKLSAAEGVLTLSGEGGEVVALPTCGFMFFSLSFEYRATRTAKVRIDDLAAMGLKNGECPLAPTQEWKAVSVDVRSKSMSIHGAAGNSIDNDIVVKLPENRVARPSEIRFAIDAADGATLKLKNVRLRPLDATPLFDGKSLTGWKIFPDKKSEWSVTKEGWLAVKNGPGDLRTERTFGDFLFQTEARSNGDALNSGIFFRCIDGQYQNGYEAQIHNGFKDGDRTKPSDFGTGAIYRRIAARKVVPEDRRWFALTIVAQGKRLRTWVDGYPTVDWVDDRKEDENARKGARTAPGHLSIQGHDPTTDLNFRELRIVEYPSGGPKSK